MAVIGLELLVGGTGAGADGEILVLLGVCVGTVRAGVISVGTASLGAVGGTGGCKREARSAATCARWCAGRVGDAIRVLR